MCGLAARGICLVSSWLRHQQCVLASRASLVCGLAAGLLGWAGTPVTQRLQAAGCSDWTSPPACSLGRNLTKALVVRPAACRWKRRLSHLAQYFSAYRIDHILGFCRIWEIPGDCATGGICAARQSFEAGGPCRASRRAARGIVDRSCSAAAVVAAAGMPAVLTVCRLGSTGQQDRPLVHAVRAPLCCPAPKTLHLSPQNPAGLLGYFRPSIPITAKDLEVRGMSGPAVLERLTGAGHEHG